MLWKPFGKTLGVVRPPYHWGGGKAEVGTGDDLARRTGTMAKINRARIGGLHRQPGDQGGKVETVVI